MARFTLLGMVLVILPPAYHMIDSTECHTNYCAVHNLYCAESSVITIFSATFRLERTCKVYRRTKCLNNDCIRHPNETTVSLTKENIIKACWNKTVCNVATYVGKTECTRRSRKRVPRRIESTIEYECTEASITSHESTPELFTSTEVPSTITASSRTTGFTATDWAYLSNTRSVAVEGYVHKHSQDTEAIVGGAIGCIVVVIIVFIVIVVFLKRRRSNTEKSERKNCTTISNTPSQFVVEDEQPRYITLDDDKYTLNNATRSNNESSTDNHIDDLNKMETSGHGEFIDIGANRDATRYHGANYNLQLYTTAPSRHVKPGANQEYYMYVNGVGDQTYNHIGDTQSDTVKYCPENYNHIVDKCNNSNTSYDTYNHIVGPSSDKHNPDNYSHIPLDDTYNHIVNFAESEIPKNNRDNYDHIGVDDCGIRLESNNVYNHITETALLDNDYHNIRGDNVGGLVFQDDEYSHITELTAPSIKHDDESADAPQRTDYENISDFLKYSTEDVQVQ